MKASQVVVGVALVAQSNAFLAPSTGSALARSATRSAVAPMRMQSNNASDNVRRAADAAKDAAKTGLNKAENAVDNAANKVDAKAGQVSSSSKTQVSGGTEIRAADIKGKEVIREAPLTAVHIHEEETIVDKTKVEEERIKTEVVQKVQPIHDEERRAVDVKRVDHGTEIRHEGQSGLDQATQAELEKRRQQLEATTQTTKDKSRREVSMRPEVVTNEQTRVIEQVVPVLDKDIYVPKREEHEKKIVNVIHESPEIVGTQVEQTISKEEFEKKYGTKLDVAATGATAAGAVNTTGASTSVRTSTTGAASSSNPMSNAATANTSAAADARKAAGSAASPSYAKGTAGATPAQTQQTSAYISEHQKQQQFDAARSAAAGTGYTASTSTSAHKDDEPAPYSMSSSNMAKEAEEAAETEGPGIGTKIKNAIKNIVE